MPAFISNRLLAIGEAMVELAPEGGNHYQQGFAGDTFNTICHIGQLLKERAKAGFVTGLGTDGFSERFIAEMQDDGLDTTAVLRIPDHTMGLYLIELKGVERSFHYWRKDSAARHLADDAPALNQALAGSGLIHVSGITLAILSPDARETLFAALSAARGAGSIISFDPNVRPRLWASTEECRQTIKSMLSFTDIALPSFDDEAWLWGDRDPDATVQRLMAHGVAEVLVKDGAGPVTAATGHGTLRIETPPVTAIRDTTGAGDSFNAGYLAGRFLGLEMEAAIALGQRLSAAVLARLGARADRSEIDAIRSVLGR